MARRGLLIKASPARVDEDHQHHARGWHPELAVPHMYVLSSGLGSRVLAARLSFDIVPDAQYLVDAVSGFTNALGFAPYSLAIQNEPQVQWIQDAALVSLAEA
jgi:hypothetical protein